jgi:D-erythro-7,8-dihydroneopterin triphosphate epimerase
VDKIIIRELRTRCVLGVTEEERRQKQEVVITLTLATDCRTPGRSDRFIDAVDYRALKRRVLAAVEPSSFFLLEALAEYIAQVCLEPRAVTAVTVSVDKPGALSYARSVAVEITRERVE